MKTIKDNIKEAIKQAEDYRERRYEVYRNYSCIEDWEAKRLAEADAYDYIKGYIDLTILSNEEE